MPDQLTFADGLVGFPDLHVFAAQAIDGAPFLVLDSIDDEGFGVVVAPADDLRPGLADELRQAGSAPRDQDVLVVLSVHGDPPEMTANLAGPLFVDPATGAARQAVLEGDSYQLRAPVGEVP